MLKDKHGKNLSAAQVAQKGLNRLSAIWLELVTGFLWWGVGETPLHHVRRFFYRLAGSKLAKVPVFICVFVFTILEECTLVKTPSSVSVLY